MTIHGWLRWYYLLVTSSIYLLSLPSKDVLSIDAVIPLQSSMEPIKEVDVETKIDMETSVMCSHACKQE